MINVLLRSLPLLLFTAVSVQPQAPLTLAGTLPPAETILIQKIKVNSEMLATGIHCDPKPGEQRPAPPCPIPERLMTTKLSSIKVSNLFPSRGRGDMSSIELEVRFPDLSNVLDTAVGIYDSKGILVGQLSCNCEKKLSSLEKGEAIQFTLRDAAKAVRMTEVRGDYSIAVYVLYRSDNKPRRNSFLTARTVLNEM